MNSKAILSDTRRTIQWMDKLPAKIHHLSKEIRSCTRMRRKTKKSEERSHKPQETPRIAVARKKIEIPAIKFEEKRQRNEKTDDVRWSKLCLPSY
jgi:hypothetical protein